MSQSEQGRGVSFIHGQETARDIFSKNSTLYSDVYELVGHTLIEASTGDSIRQYEIGSWQWQGFMRGVFSVVLEIPKTDAESVDQS